MRDCGACTACCHSLGVDELQKPTFLSCEHIGPRGCRCYHTRPASCRSFQCLWLLGMLDEADRPDRLGVIFCSTHHPAVGNVPMLVEHRPGALRNVTVQRKLDAMLDRVPVVVLTQHGREVLSRPSRRARPAAPAAAGTPPVEVTVRGVSMPAASA